MTTKARITRIGNSRGIRIPRSLLDQSELPEQVEIHAEPGRLIVTGPTRARAGWASAAREMRAEGDDLLLDEPTAPDLDADEWRW